MGLINDDRWVPWPFSVKIMPTLIEELLGRKVRIVYLEDSITEEHQPGCITIYITEDHLIYDIEIESNVVQNSIKIGLNGLGDNPIIPWPTLSLLLKNDLVLIKQLLGRKVRIVYPEDRITEEYQPGRITIYITEEHLISDIKSESDIPIE
ncbi:hypothetical protein [Acinetobacter johnsonii]|uniref:hypothetical protein n=1 Tax=Acinetobacter johnsonii TaxID=40214 RepID=UPI0032B47BFF